MKQFFLTIRRSIHDPSFYAELPSHSLGSGWGYFSGLSLLLAIVFTVALSLPMVPAIRPVLDEIERVTYEVYPDTLELRLDGGILSMNAPSPVYLPLPAILREGVPERDGVPMFRRLAVIDTETPISSDAYWAHGAMAWLGRMELAAFRNGGVSIVPYGPEASFVVTEDSIGTFFDALRPYYRFVAPTLVAIIAFGLLLSFGVKFVWLLIGALYILVLGRTMGFRWSYGESYVIGLHALTLPMLIGAALIPFGVGLGMVPFLVSIIVLVVVYMNVKDLPRPGVSAPAPAPVAPMPTPTAGDASMS